MVISNSSAGRNPGFSTVFHLTLRDYPAQIAWIFLVLNTQVDMYNPHRNGEFNILCASNIERVYATNNRYVCHFNWEA